MNPTNYQQLMAQQLMGAAMAAPGTTGQNASTPYGQAFITGNQMRPMQMGQQGFSNPSAQSGGYPGMLGQSAATLLQQPMATYA